VTFFLIDDYNDDDDNEDEDEVVVVRWVLLFFLGSLTLLTAPCLKVLLLFSLPADIL
jgi:hypothetical protein